MVIGKLARMVDGMRLEGIIEKSISEGCNAQNDYEYKPMCGGNHE